MQITEFPVMRAVELCQPFSSQRIDALFIIILVILAVMGISVQTVTASQITEMLFPKFRYLLLKLQYLLLLKSTKQRCLVCYRWLGCRKLD